MSRSSVSSRLAIPIPRGTLYGYLRSCRPIWRTSSFCVCSSVSLCPRFASTPLAWPIRGRRTARWCRACWAKVGEKGKSKSKSDADAMLDDLEERPPRPKQARGRGSDDS
eukprot:8642260-Pyramimonas_sp.AAC.1